MIHKHFESCSSTQKYLIEMTPQNPGKHILVSCDEQINGVGQRENTWDCYENTLCFSFTAKACDILNLTSLEMGIQVCQFVQQFYGIKLKLKWPNDILNSNNLKVGGIIVNKQGDNDPIIGIGLNLFKSNNENLKNYDIAAGFIFDQEIKYTKKQMASHIFSYILNNRLNSEKIKFYWNSLCFHLNKEVIIEDDKKKNFGIFEGIGEYGQAIIKNEGQSLEFYSGILRINY